MAHRWRVSLERRRRLFTLSDVFAHHNVLVHHNVQFALNFEIIAGYGWRVTQLSGDKATR